MEPHDAQRREVVRGECKCGAPGPRAAPPPEAQTPHENTRKRVSPSLGVAAWSPPSPPPPRTTPTSSRRGAAGVFPPIWGGRRRRGRGRRAAAPLPAGLRGGARPGLRALKEARFLVSTQTQVRSNLVSPSPISNNGLLSCSPPPKKRETKCLGG